MIIDCSLPIVSVVTVCLNAEATIKRAIESVLAQSYGNIEYIVIDGGSTDNTITIIESYMPFLQVVVSEKDNGISDAFNKGIRLAKGEYIQLLNADDWFPPDKIRTSVQSLEENSDCSFVFGDLIITDSEGKAILTVAGDPKYRTLFRYTMPRVNHPTMLVRKSVYDRYGCFDDMLRIAMDYDWILRITQLGESGCYNPSVITFMQEGGISSKWKEALRENKEVSSKHGLSPIIALLIYHLLSTKVRCRLFLQKFLAPCIIMLFRSGKSLC